MQVKPQEQEQSLVACRVGPGSGSVQIRASLCWPTVSLVKGNETFLKIQLGGCTGHTSGSGWSHVASGQYTGQGRQKGHSHHLGRSIEQHWT